MYFRGFVLALLLFLVGCNSISSSQGKPTYKVSIPVVEKPAPTTVINLPLVPVGDVQADPSWTLEPRFLDVSPAGVDFTVRLNTPFITGAGAMEHEVFNQGVQALVDEWLRTYTTEQLGTPEPGFGWSVSIDYQVTSAPDWIPAMPFAVSSKMPQQQSPSQVTFMGGHDLISILFEDYFYLGGAHPAKFYSTLNYDTTSHEILTLADLFTPGVDHLGVIASICIAELKSRPGLTFEEFASSGAASLADNYQVWAVTPQGLLILFQEYQVGPYAAGAQLVLIPYDDIAVHLDPGGPLGWLSQ